MGDTFVVSCLVKKHAELSDELEVLTQQMIQFKGEISTIDNVIHLFDPEYNVEDIMCVMRLHGCAIRVPSMKSGQSQGPHTNEKCSK